MRIDIPEYKTMDLKYLVLDYNGTIAEDGVISGGVKEQLKKLSGIYEIYVLTADTHGTAKAMCEGLPLTIQTFPSGAAAEEKKKIIEKLGKEQCIAVGNGRNDVPMCEQAELSVGVIGAEGAYGKLIGSVDICVRSIEETLDILGKNTRLVATLRG